MIALSETAGKILAVRNPLGVLARDSLTYLAGLLPSVKRYFLEMRFKPMPRYRLGALDYGPAGFHPDANSTSRLLHPYQDAPLSPWR